MFEALVAMPYSTTQDIWLESQFMKMSPEEQAIYHDAMGIGKGYVKPETAEEEEVEVDALVKLASFMHF